MNRTHIAGFTMLLLAACGGGGGDSAPATTPPAGGGATEVAYSFNLPGGGSTSSAVLAQEVVVMLASGVAVADVAATYGATVLDRFGQRPIHRLRLAAGASLTDTLARMAGDARIRFAEPNAVNSSPEKKDQVVWAIGGDDASRTAQYAPQALALPAALSLSTGAGVRVAVLDTGIDAAHPVFAGRLARGAGGALLGRDFVDGDADPAEAGSATDAGWGHGTHVASVIALAAPGAPIMPVRVLDAAGRGNVWVLAEALLWAIDPDGDPRTDDGARVVNISLGTTAPTQLLDLAIELASCNDDDDDDEPIDRSDPGFDDDRLRCNLRPGAVVMAAAGNSGSPTERVYPAAEAVEGQLAVTASDSAGRLTSFANRGSWVQLAAPGDRIVGAIPGGAYASWSGTSMATPWASAVSALVLARNPDWKPVDVSKRLLDRSVRLCGSNTLRGLHAEGAVADFVPPDPACP
jgi:subtilisin family serine protease